ncbi:MAG: YidC/Oxa1 family membrane protein insertase [Patescibacteria group bacterium]
MTSFFHEILFKPLFNILIFLYETVAFFDLGLAIIILTIIIRFALYPLSQKAIRSQKEMFAIQPEIKAIQEKYKDKKEEQVKMVMALYKEKKVNPFSGCLPILVQLPILIALYWVFMSGFDSENLNNLYSFIKNPGEINYTFLGFINISEKNFYIALIAGIFQFYQSKMVLKQQLKARIGIKNKSKNPMDDISISISKQMTYVMPVMTVIIASSLHAGLALYWITTTLFSIFQQWYVFSKKEEK